MTPRTMAIIRLLNRYPTEIAAVTGVLAVLIGAVLSIEFNPAFRLQ
jgi:hypothetical protein